MPFLQGPQVLIFLTQAPPTSKMSEVSWFCAGLLKGIGEGSFTAPFCNLLVPRKVQENCRGLWLCRLEVAAKEMSPGAPAANANSLEKSCGDSLKGGSARECSYFLLGFLQGVGGFRHQRSCLCPGKLQIQHFAKRSVLKGALLELAFFREAKYLIFLKRSFPSERCRIPKKEYDIN